MVQKDYEEKMKRILENEKGDLKITYFPLGDTDFPRDNSFPVILPVKLEIKNNSLLYHISLGENETLSVDYGTASWKNQDTRDLEKIISLNETLARGLGCSTLHVKMLSKEIANIYSKKEYDYFSKGFKSFGFKTLIQSKD